MARGRPRKPTELKVLQGCPGGHLSERFNPDEPIPNGPLGVPAQALRLTPLVQEQWDYLVSIIAPGVAMCCDAPLMALTARLMGGDARRRPGRPARRQGRPPPLLPAAAPLTTGEIGRAHV